MDLWHTAILTISIMSCFAGVATWRFGPYLEEFSSFKRTLQTEFIMLFGSIEYVHWTSPGHPKMPRAELELQVFVSLYLMVTFLLVLNFVLAVIVEAYVNPDLPPEENDLTSLTAKVKEFIYLLEDLQPEQLAGLQIDELKSFLQEQMRNAYDIKEGQIDLALALVCGESDL